MGAQRSADALSSPTEPSSTVSALTGFDPSRGDCEMLAILLWDFFGPYSPRTSEEIHARSYKASLRGVSQYRACAKQIAESLRFYRNVELDAAIPEGETPNA